MVNLSGQLASTFAPVKGGVTAFVDYYNAHGGLEGHHLDLQVYDDASSPSQTLANARLAVSNGDQVLVGQEYLLSSAVPYIQAQNVPFFGFGLTPNFFGADKKNFFSFTGNFITAATDTVYRFLIQNQHLTNIALVSDSQPANAETLPALKPIVLSLGGKVPYYNAAVDDTNSASLLALAEKLKSTDTQFVWTDFVGYAPAQLQADLAQIGSKILVGTGIIGFDPQVPKQFGSAANGLEAVLFSASWINPQVPGVQTYLSAMNQYAPSLTENQQALYGWDAMLNLQGALQALGSKPPTRTNILTAGNTLQNFTAGGMLSPVSFPQFHTVPTPCEVFGQLQNGQWTRISGTPTAPTFCGKQYTG
jgi:branched-chain amino acid transport system substrate-binding protein